MKLGDKVRRRREELDMTMEELAKKMGVKNRSSVHHWETAENLSGEVINRLAECLHVKTSYFFDDYKQIDTDIIAEITYNDELRHTVEAYNKLNAENQNTIKLQIEFLLYKQEKGC